MHPTRLFLPLLLLFSTMGLIACGDDSPATVCVSGATQLCVGPGGCTGGQSCLASGTGWNTCQCDAPPPSDGGQDGGGGRDAGPPDSGIADGGSSDSGTAPDAGCVGFACPSPVAACVNGGDQAIIAAMDGSDAGPGSGYENLRGLMENCSRTDCLGEFLGGADLPFVACMDVCVDGTTAAGLTGDCRECYYRLEQCMATHCTIECIGGDSQACIDCVDVYCSPELNRCTEGTPCAGAAPASGCGQSCAAMSPCPLGYFCGAGDQCDAECWRDGDTFCPSGGCTADGRCIDMDTICMGTSVSCGQACAGQPAPCGQGCVTDGECPGGYYCGGGGQCSRDCNASNDQFCPTGACDADGRCQDPSNPMNDGGPICARQLVPSTLEPNPSCTVPLQGQVLDWFQDRCEEGAFTFVEPGGNRIPVPCDPTGGWQLTAEDTIELFGVACDLKTNTPGLTPDVSFPCTSVYVP